MKIAELVGKPLKVAMATQGRDRLNYARVMIEVSMNGAFPEQIQFENEYGKLITQPIYFEWKPIKCSICGLLGHYVTTCMKDHPPVRRTSKQWVPKTVVPTLHIAQEAPPKIQGVAQTQTDTIFDPEGFQRPSNPIKRTVN